VRGLLDLLERRRIESRWRGQRARGARPAVFIWIPKCAGTSVADVLEAEYGWQRYLEAASVARFFPQCGQVTFGHMSYRHLLERGLVEHRFDDAALKFAIVRDPFDRAVSLYEYLKQLERLHPSTSFRTFCGILADRAYDGIGLFNAQGLSQCSPQVRWLEAIDPAALRLLRFEQLSTGFPRMLSECHPSSVRTGALPELNKTHRKQQAEYYAEPGCAELIRSAYAEDFERFGYAPAIGRA